MPTTTDPLDDFVETAAHILGLSLEPEWTVSVKANLEVTLKHAAVVGEFDLPDDTEPAPVFKA